MPCLSSVYRAAVYQICASQINHTAFSVLMLLIYFEVFLCESVFIIWSAYYECSVTVMMMMMMLLRWCGWEWQQWCWWWWHWRCCCTQMSRWSVVVCRHSSHHCTSPSSTPSPLWARCQKSAAERSQLLHSRLSCISRNSAIVSCSLPLS